MPMSARACHRSEGGLRPSTQKLGIRQRRARMGQLECDGNVVEYMPVFDVGKSTLFPAVIYATGIYKDVAPTQRRQREGIDSGQAKCYPPEIHQ